MTDAAGAVKRIVPMGPSMQNSAMKHQTSFLLTALTCTLLTAGCAREIDYREGATMAEVNRARDTCALAAETQAPYRPATRMEPGDWIPERKVCDAAGNCTIRPGRMGLPQIVRYDGNATRRVLLARTCLADKGFDRVSLPYCQSNVRNATPQAVTRVLPPLTPQSCIIGRGGSAYQIVSP